MMVPVSRLAILYTYSKDKLLGVINFITIPGLVGPIIGPTLGGWLVDIASWHWNFLDQYSYRNRRNTFCPKIYA